MKTKHVLSLLVALILGTGIAIAQQNPAPPADVNDDSADVFTFVVGGGYLGVYAEDISKENMSRYGLSQVRGVAITRVVKDSPAEKAGLRVNDVILRIDGESVTSVRKLNRVVSEIAPDQTVRISISRAGAEQEFSAIMGRREGNKAFQGLLKGGDLGNLGNLGNLGHWEWEGPQFKNDGAPWTFAFNGSRRIGINTTELTKQLADYFGVTGGRGVLVTSVFDDGPAAKAGVKAGDVITAIDGEAVDSSGDISRVINRRKDGEVTLTIVRNKTQQTIRVMPVEGGLPTRTIDRPQIGRRIVIPRVQLETIPEINISMPSIRVPSPVVDIQMPRITVPMPAITVPMPNITVPMPNIRVIRRSGGPI